MIAPEIATTATWECVHLALFSKVGKKSNGVKSAASPRFRLISLVCRRNELTRIASAMKFPDDFGMNWDALTDSLRDLSWLNPKGVLVVLENSRDLWRQPMLAGSLIETWLVCAEFWARTASRYSDSLGTENAEDLGTTTPSPYRVPAVCVPGRARATFREGGGVAKSPPCV